MSTVITELTEQIVTLKRQLQEKEIYIKFLQESACKCGGSCGCHGKDHDDKLVENKTEISRNAS